MGDTMKYIRVIICLLFTFLLFGCSATYDLDIDKELKINESLNLSLSSDTDYSKLSEFNSNLPVDINVDDVEAFNNKKNDIDYFDIKKSLDSNLISFNYDYLDYNNLDSDRIINTCYDYFSLVNKNDNDNYKLILSTSKKFNCFDLYDNLDDVTINISTKKKVYDNNADSVNGNTYTWYINKDTKDDAAISIVMDGSIDKSLSFFEKNILFIIILGVLFIGLIIYLIIKKRSDKVNKI